MKKLLFILLCFVIAGCNRESDQAGNTKDASAKDSLVNQVKQRDSSIIAYVRSVNKIQKSIDTLMSDAKILRIHGEERMKDTNTIADELRAIDKLILKNRKDITNLEIKLKVSNEKNQELADLGENLSLQLNEKDSEIAVTQRMLVSTKASLGSLVKQFNDSLNVINQQRNQIDIMKIKGNTVYYVLGTEGNLEKQGIIVKRGGVIGLGRVPVLGPNMNTSGFQSADLTILHKIELGGRFVKFVTDHSVDSYRITSGSTDKLIITDPEDFWSRSKYMVLIIK